MDLPLDFCYLLFPDYDWAIRIGANRFGILGWAAGTLSHGKPCSIIAFGPAGSIHFDQSPPAVAAVAVVGLVVLTAAVAEVVVKCRKTT